MWTAAQAHGISAKNVRLEKIGDADMDGRYKATSTSGSKLEPLEFELVQQKDTGFRVVFPPQEELNH
ncbi:hypothetical protein CQ018_09645 [Arthrobacter sp. MYb227]|uniref:hypothetical protein n=1 Tax=Arthrobacter sp. MYb227 TaxID=1848601 RepID=UPI000CFC749E|nr:hypothetical protein [Arthrobacter sp. MYb227]PQZ93891.1 hypothetical protein CQ018_09645 [Arthrobacter sp. MYb227]